MFGSRLIFPRRLPGGERTVVFNMTTEREGNLNGQFHLLADNKHTVLVKICAAYASKVSNSSRLLFDTATCILFSMMR